MRATRKQRARRQFVIGLIPLLLGLLALGLSPDLERYLEFGPYFYPQYLAVSLAMVALGVGQLLMLYLRGGLKDALEIRGSTRPLLRSSVLGEHSDSNDDSALGEIARQIRELRDHIDNLVPPDSVVSSEDRLSLVEHLKASITKDLGESVVGVIEDKYRDKIPEHISVRELENHYKATWRRLNSEVNALGRRGNLNLVLGTMSTAGAIGVLAYLVLNSDFEAVDFPKIISFFLPRLSLAIFIEIFAFFFLRLYKAGLAEIKYFQNELTNVELRYAALSVSLREKNKAAIAESLHSLAATERNFVLKQGESTVDLERLRMENEHSNAIVESLTNAVGRLGDR